MQVPDRVESFRDAVIRVGEGRGFLIDDGAGEPLIVTAAECLPRVPVPQVSAYAIDTSFEDLVGVLGEPPASTGQCVFADPIANVAVLGEPEGHGLFDDWEVFAGLVASRPRLVVGEFDGTSRCWLLGGSERWLECRLKRQGATAALILETGDTSECVPALTGSPLLTDEGHVVAVISAPGQRAAMLVDVLPARMVRLAVETNWITLRGQGHGSTLS